MVVKESEAWDGSLGSGKGWMEKIRFHGALQIYLLSYLLQIQNGWLVWCWLTRSSWRKGRKTSLIVISRLNQSISQSINQSKLIYLCLYRKPMKDTSFYETGRMFTSLYARPTFNKVSPAKLVEN